jgi:hypothetical protein
MLLRDLVKIFPDQAQQMKDNKENLYIIPTFQPTLCDMTDYSEETERRKNELLHNVHNASNLNI